MKSAASYIQYAQIFLFSILFVCGLLLGTLALLDAFSVLTATPENLKKWPFGTEQGHAYLSKEIYYKHTLGGGYLLVQNTVIALLLFRNKSKRWLSIALLLITFAFLSFDSYSGDILYHQ